MSPSGQHGRQDERKLRLRHSRPDVPLRIQWVRVHLGEGALSYIPRPEGKRDPAEPSGPREDLAAVFAAGVEE